MKKYIIGALFGIALTLSTNVFADDIKSLIGKSIQGEFPVSVNGESLDKKAIVIDGTSFLPVKAVGDSLNLDVTFDKKTGISLKEKEIIKGVVPIETSDISKTVTNGVYGNNTVEYLDSAIETNKKILKDLEESLKKLNDNDAVESIQIDKLVATINKLKAAIQEFENRKAALTQ